MPWQQLAADTAGEVDERGRLCYNKVFITVPRQSGKTTLLLSVVVGRAEGAAQFGGRQNMLYAAQSREAARKKWQDDYVKNLQASELMRDRIKVRQAQGSERLTFLSTDSAFGPIATKVESGHGEVVDWGGLDEAFKQSDNRVEAAWRPAMITRPMSQFWMVSTMGDATAIWFNEQVDKARAAVEADTGRGVCYIEYSADPDDEDYGNQDKWATYMPALGITQTADKLQMEYEDLDLNEWRRAYMNQQVDAPGDQILPADQWANMVRTTEDAPRATRCILVVDVAYDRTAATIAVGYELEDGTPAVKIVDHGRGTSWVTERVLELREELDPVKIIADNKGPCASVITELEAEYVQLYKTSQQELVAACALIFDGVTDEKFVHYNQPPLNKAVQGAGKRELADAWAWTRRKSQENAATDISPLVAVTLAYWAQVSMGEHADYDWKDSFG